MGINHILTTFAPTETLRCKICGSDKIYISGIYKYWPVFDVYCDNCGERLGYIHLDDHIDWESVGEFVEDCEVV